MKPTGAEQQDFDNLMLGVLEKMQSGGSSEEEIARARREWRGGDCPKCGTPYKQEEVKENRITSRSWKYYLPNCNCEQVEEMRRERKQKLDAVCEKAGVPAMYFDATMENLNTEVSDKIKSAYARVLEWYGNGWESPLKKVNSAFSSLFMYGAVGTGKTHCAVAMLKRFGDTDSVFLRMAGLVADIIEKRVNVDEVSRKKLIVIDDLDKISMASEWAKEQVFRLIDSAIGRQSIIIITSNFQSAQDIAEKLGEALMSRLMMVCRWVKFDGTPADDYRLKIAKDTRAAIEAQV